MAGPTGKTGKRFHGRAYPDGGRKYRDEKKREALPLSDLLKQTSGIWKGGDGLSYQRRLRKEWQK
jgi:hypothetical protein